MEEYKSLTLTQLLKLVNDTNKEHELVKSDIIDLTFKIDELENDINMKLEYLRSLENKYITLIEEMNNR